MPLHIVKLDANVLNPLLVRTVIRQPRFKLFVIDHATLLEVDQEHLAGLQTPLAHDLALRYWQHARLRAHDHHVVVSDAIARRTQTIAIQSCADLSAVGKDDRCRTIPWLHHGGVVFVKRFAALVHGGVVFPWLGNHHHHGLAEWVARHREQL